MERQHDKHLDELLTHPHILGIENVLFSCKEMKFYEPNSNNIYCEPDLIFFNGKYHAVEYKASQEHRHMAIHQLHRAKESIMELWNKTPELLFVYPMRKGRYGVEHV